MESIIESSEVELKSIENDLKHILESYQVIVSNHFKIDEYALTTSERLKVEKRLPKKRVNKFKKIYTLVNNL